MTVHTESGKKKTDAVGVFVMNERTQSYTTKLIINLAIAVASSNVKLLKLRPFSSSGL